MGLDMYVYATAEHNLVDASVETDVKFVDKNLVEEIYYWRKFHQLHGWMASLYSIKGGESADFNLNTVRLYTEDLDALLRTVGEGALPPTVGFFFGNSEWEEADSEDIKEFVKKAKGAIEEGKAVFYDSWW